jgi:hypothetical protein
MKIHRVTVAELTERLKAVGVDMSCGGVANKIVHTEFSLVFLQESFEALDMDLRA